MNTLKSIEAMYSLDKHELEEIMNDSKTKVRVTAAPGILGSFKTDTLIGVTKEDIVQILGFEPNVPDDPDKVVHSWAFYINDLPCAIWDWKGSHEAQRWSVYDPHGVMALLFKKVYTVSESW